jgi:lysophospholipase L1-like esterase
MRILKTVAFLVALLVGLTLLKHLLDKISSSTIVFHYNLLTCIQYFILAGIILWALLQGVWWLRYKRPFKLLHFWIIYLTILGCSELFFYYFLRNASEAGPRLHQLLVDYYMEYDINFPEIEYDSELSYTLKKNAIYNHINPEFSNMVRTNSAGLRDDNASLVQPDIICLGDSYTQGWGVTQGLTFSSLVERATGLKVLNAGITSYGTAREMLLLKRLDTSRLKYLVIQYCSNDYPENQAFLKNGSYLPVGSQQKIEQGYWSHELGRRYFPFKYSFTMLRMSIRQNISRPPSAEATAGTFVQQGDLSYVAPSAEAFLKILAGSINFSSTKVFIMDTNAYPLFDHHLLDSLENRIHRAATLPQGFKENVRIVRFPELNNRKYFYALDNHLNNDGHKVVAGRILEAIKAASTSKK